MEGLKRAVDEALGKLTRYYSQQDEAEKKKPPSGFKKLVTFVLRVDSIATRVLAYAPYLPSPESLKQLLLP